MRASSKASACSLQRCWERTNTIWKQNAVEKVSERTQRTYLILFDFLLHLGHQDFMYIFSKAIRITSKIPDCLIYSFHSIRLLGNMFTEGVWTCCITRSGAGCLSKNLQEGHAEQERLGLLGGSRADLPYVSGLFFLTVLPRKQE